MHVGLAEWATNDYSE